MRYRVSCTSPLFSGWWRLFNQNTPNALPLSATLEQEANRSGIFTFSIAPGNPLYDKLVLFKSGIIIDQEEPPYDTVWIGHVASEDTDIDGIKTYTCYDEIGYFDYSIQRPRTISGTPTQVISSLLAEHNSQVGRTIVVGTMPSSLASVSIDTDYGSTLQYINNLAEQYGGYFRMRYEMPYYALDWLDGSPKQSNQVIQLGSNIMDFSKSVQTDDFGTVLIPLGNNGLTIASVNGGLDYLESANSATYGKIWRTVSFDDINNASDLKTAGQTYLAQTENPITSFEISAVDLSQAFSYVDLIQLLDSVQVVSPKHGLNARFDVTKLYTDILNPENNRITLNKNMRLPISRSVANLQNK